MERIALTSYAALVMATLVLAVDDTDILLGSLYKLRQEFPIGRGQSERVDVRCSCSIISDEYRQTLFFSLRTNANAYIIEE